MRIRLAESLEEYAARNAMSIRDARKPWRQDGMNLLVGFDPFRAVAADGPRIAPGERVPIPGFAPVDVIEVEP
jgi:hypothetical protein